MTGSIDGQFAAALRARVAAAASAPAYETYRSVLSHVLRMKDARGSDGGTGRPSDLWAEDLANMEYLLDASPLLVEKLRHHTYHITGLYVYDYRDGKPKVRQRFDQKLASLVALGGSRLLVPESPALGGFGFDVDGSLFNVDTLKFYESLIALERAGVLANLEEASSRPVAWEIGAGWGGFAYQLKTLCPNLTYYIVDFPELFLFSATYLQTMFPDARVRFFGDDIGPDTDFVFVPHTALASFAPPRIDLTINMQSFQEMTTEQVSAYVARAADLGSRWLYSMNRDRSPDNEQLTSVEALLAERFAISEIELPLEGSSPVKPPKPGREGDRVAPYRHLIGRG